MFLNCLASNLIVQPVRAKTPYLREVFKMVVLELCHQGAALDTSVVLDNVAFDV